MVQSYDTAALPIYYSFWKVELFIACFCIHNHLTSIRFRSDDRVGRNITFFHVLGECFLSPHGLSITRFSSLEIYHANKLQSFFSISSVILIGLCPCIFEIIPSISFSLQRCTHFRILLLSWWWLVFRLNLGTVYIHRLWVG
jgi:hypothetical protein